MSDSQPASANRAVFLSYASQDAQAAKRICEALRAAGVEVWFDQDALVGGDAWDQKIRGQVASCALFVPVVSASTQARREGYFRLEWKLADERTHLMAEGTPFLLPVVIDETKDREALVPKSFLGVQWTKLQGGETPAAFCQRVKKLLGGEEPARAALRRDGSAESRQHAAPTTRPKWLVPAILVVLAGIGLALWQPWKKSAPPAPAAIRAAASLTEAQKLVEQARKIYEDGDELNSDNLFLADEMVQRALALDPTEPSAWELAAWFSYLMLWHRIDDSPARSETLLRQANRAVALAPDSVASQLVFANAQLAVRSSGGNASLGSLTSIEAGLQQLAGREPQNWKIQRALGTVYRLTQRTDEAIRAFTRAIELSGGQPMATGDLVNVLIRRNRYAEAETLLAQGLARQRSSRLLTFDLIVKCRGRGEVAGVARDIADWPAWLLQQDRGFAVAWQAALWARQPDLALSLVQQFPRQKVQDFTFSGPRAALSARAQELAGNAVAAQADWRDVLQQCDQELAANRSHLIALYWKTWALARLGDQAAAQSAATLLRQRLQTGPDGYIRSYNAAALWATVGWTEVAVATLKAELEQPSDFISLTRAGLELEPAFDPLRQDPRFRELIEMAPAPQSTAATAPKLDDKSIAVLAFANLSDDKGNEYFSDGISEELLNVLAKVPKLKVAARTSSFYFKGQNVPIPEIAQKLGVAYVVEGSVRKAGNKVRITAQLIKAADGFHVWSETYDRELQDIFAVQDEIAKNILTAVKGSLIGETELPRATTTKIEAYTLYLQAQGAFAKRGAANLREAMRLHEAALAIDPNYVPALVGLAQARSLFPVYAYLDGTRVREFAEGAKQAAGRALELEPQNAAAYAVIGYTLSRLEWRWSEGAAAMLRARDLAPNEAWNWNCLGDYYLAVCDAPHALAAKQRQWELDPLSPVSHWDLAGSYLCAGDYDQAIHWGQLAKALAPDSLYAYLTIILAASRSGRWDLMRTTVAEARRNVAESEGVMRLLEAHGAILEKKPAEARRILAGVPPFVESGQASPAILGLCHLLLGDSDQAVVWLRRAYDRRDLVLVSNGTLDFDLIAANPATRPILDEPGIKELYEIRQQNTRAGRNKL